MAFTRPTAAQINFDLVNLTDPLIRLNSGETGSADKDAGFVIERGNDTNVGLIYDESADSFALINTDEIGTTAGNVTIASYADLKVGALETSGNVSVTGNLSVSGTTTTVDVNSINITNSFTFEGATPDGNETKLTVVDPTADRTITLPNATGTVALTATVLALAGGTMSGAIAMGTNKITGVGDPTSAQDVVTKAYFDANTSSFSSNASGFLNSTFITVPGAVNFDLVKQQDQSGDAETPFVASGSLDAFGVSLSEVYDMMEPIGKSTTTDLGALS
mgnify:CR=1 FL=1